MVTISIKSQTSTEYLILLAVVIIIALIVVSALFGIPGIGGNINPDIINQRAASQLVGIENVQLLSSGVTMTVVNNLPQPVQIQSITINGEPISLRSSITLNAGERRQIVGYSGVPGYTKTISDIQILYENRGSQFTVNTKIVYQVPQRVMQEGLIGLWHFNEPY